MERQAKRDSVAKVYEQRFGSMMGARRPLDKV